MTTTSSDVVTDHPFHKWCWCGSENPSGLDLICGYYNEDLTRCGKHKDQHNPPPQV